MKRKFVVSAKSKFYCNLIPKFDNVHVIKLHEYEPLLSKKRTIKPIEIKTIAIPRMYFRDSLGVKLLGANEVLNQYPSPKMKGYNRYITPNATKMSPCK